MFLCNFYPRERIFDCARLLVVRGIDLEAKTHTAQDALRILCLNYEGDNLLDVALLLLYNLPNLDCAPKYSEILWKRGFNEESKTFSRVFTLLRQGGNPVSIQLTYFSNNQNGNLFSLFLLYHRKMLN